MKCQYQGGYQLDTSNANPKYFEYPEFMPMRNTAEHMVSFRVPRDMDVTRYQVVVRTKDVTAGSPIVCTRDALARSIGQLGRVAGKCEYTLKLPEVYFDWNAPIALVPDSASLPYFQATLSRGSTYIVPCVKGNGNYKMQRLGAIGVGL